MNKNFEIDINKIIERLGQKIATLEIENIKLMVLVEQLQADLILANKKLREMENEND